MNSKKIISGIYAIAIYFLLIYLILLFYNVHEQKAKNYVEKNSNRVTVTLVNSDKILLNKNSKVNMPNKPVPKFKAPKKQDIPKKPVSKKTVPKKSVPKKDIPKKSTSEKPIPKKPPVKKDVPKKDIEAIKKADKIKKIKEDNERAKLVELKKAKEEKKLAETKRRKDIEAIKKEEREEAKKRVKKEELEKNRVREEQIEKEQIAKKKKEKERIRKEKEEAKAEQVKKEQIKKEKDRKERANSLFSSIDTPKPSQSSHTAKDRNQNQATHQSGNVSDKNREKGVENAYIARIQRKLRNWPAQSDYKGDQVKINFTIYSSGRFKFRITSRSGNPNFNRGVTEYLKQLQRMGFGTHSKSTPYDIDVIFKAR